MDFKTLFRNYSRYFLIVFNFLFLLTGVTLISVGTSVKAYYNEYETFLDSKYIYASDLLIVIGVIIFLISFFGCCGALKENACMTTTFSTLLIVIFVLELLIGIGGFLLKHRTEEILSASLEKTMTQYNTTNNTEITVLWDKIQTEFHCCGVNNYTEWYKQLNSTSLPLSCCHVPAGTSGMYACNAHDVYPEGCLELFGDFVEGNAKSIAIVGMVLGAIQLLGIVFSCYLAKEIRSDYETV